MRGAPARAIQELAGHQDLSTTQPYMHLSPAAIEGAIRLLDTPGVPASFGNMLATGSTETANFTGAPALVAGWNFHPSPTDAATRCTAKAGFATIRSPPSRLRGYGETTFA